MPVPLTLDFQPPAEPDIIALRVYEAASPNGVFSQIDRTTAVGSYPNYITRYVTPSANVRTDYFAIAWENSAGEVSEMSAPVQGGTTTLVSQIMNRMMLRDPSLNEIIATQEAEAAISDYYGVVDPFTVDPSTVSPKILSGLTNLALARSYMTTLVTSSQANKWAAGIVSMDTSSSAGKSVDLAKQLLELANNDLGRSFSYVMLMEEISVAGGFRRLAGVDLTRSIIEIQ